MRAGIAVERRLPCGVSARVSRNCLSPIFIPSCVAHSNLLALIRLLQMRRNLIRAADQRRPGFWIASYRFNWIHIQE